MRNEISSLSEIQKIFSVFLPNWNEDSEFGDFLHKGDVVSESTKKVHADFSEIKLNKESP